MPELIYKSQDNKMWVVLNHHICTNLLCNDPKGIQSLKIVSGTVYSICLNKFPMAAVRNHPKLGVFHHNTFILTVVEVRSPKSVSRGYGEGGSMAASFQKP